MNAIAIARVTQSGVVRVGKIIRSLRRATFRYDAEYLSNNCSMPLSRSLPLRSEEYEEDEFRPYFEGLLAEGPTRDALAAELGVKSDDYLSVLALCGRDCIGDVLAWNEVADQEPSCNGLSEIPISEKELRVFFRGLPEAAEQNAESRLSLAGNQNKIGLRREGDAWFRPLGLAATTHILKASNLRDIPEIEFLCMKAAAACGIAAANVRLCDYGRPVLAVERFDRRIVGGPGRLVVERLHQEDLAQAFGVLPVGKYAELDGGSVERIAALIRKNSANPIADIAELAKTLCFNYAIGNCDAHLKNYSLVSGSAVSGKVTISLAPAYDLVSTTYCPRFDHDLAMNYGDTRDIDEVGVSCFAGVAKALGMAPKNLAKLAKPIVDGLDSAVRDAGDGKYGEVLETTPYVADNLRVDMACRLEVLGAFVDTA